MENQQKKDMKKWIATWQKAGEALGEIKIKELRSEDYYEKNQTLLNEMLKYAFEHRTVSKSSGLVEQQRIFKRYHENAD